jgi:hypothetical protein
MNAQRRDQLRAAKIRTGVFIASYEAIALAVDNPELVPRLTDLGHRWPWIGRSMAAWTVVHLVAPGALPWLVSRVRRA